MWCVFWANEQMTQVTENLINISHISCVYVWVFSIDYGTIKSFPFDETCFTQVAGFASRKPFHSLHLCLSDTRRKFSNRLLFFCAPPLSILTYPFIHTPSRNVFIFVRIMCNRFCHCHLRCNGLYMEFQIVGDWWCAKIVTFGFSVL